MAGVCWPKRSLRENLPQMRETLNPFFIRKSTTFDHGKKAGQCGEIMDHPVQIRGEG
jgi:hypothetical protein